MRLHGVGIDLVEISRVDRLLERESFTRRWFSEAEVARCERSPEPGPEFAALLAAKEAAWKAMQLPWAAGVPWAHLEVLDSGHVGLRGPVATAAGAIASVQVQAATRGGFALSVAFAWAQPPQGTARGAPISPEHANGRGL